MIRDDHLAVLGLASDASESDVKKAHRRLVKLYHDDGDIPDRARFLKIQEAYEALADPTPHEDRAPGWNDEAEEVGAIFRSGQSSGRRGPAARRPPPPRRETESAVPPTREATASAPTTPNTPTFATRVLYLCVAAVLFIVALGGLDLLGGRDSEQQQLSTTLADRYPPSFRPCEPGPRQAAHGELVCRHPYLSIMMEFYFDSEGPSVPFSEEWPDDEHIDSRPCPKEIPAMHAFYVDGRHLGSLLCYIDDYERIVLSWSDVEAARFTRATFARGIDLKTAYQWWQSNAYEDTPSSHA